MSNLQRSRSDFLRRHQTLLGQISDMKQTGQIGIAGLAVMGENLVLNIADKGFRVSVYNRTASKTDRFLQGRAKGKTICGYHEVADFIASLERPRMVMMMLKAGVIYDDERRSLRRCCMWSKSPR